MNKQRRKTINNFIDNVGEMRRKADGIINALTALKEEASRLRESVDDVREEEQEYRDNMPDSMADSERANAADEAISQLEEAISALDVIDEFSIDEIDDALDSLIDCFNNAAGV